MIFSMNCFQFLSDSMPSQEYVTNRSKISQLELNFLKNYYSHCKDFDGDINVVMTDKIKEVQIYLHRLGYLSHSIQVDGIYTDFVLEAIKKFQVVAKMMLFTLLAVLFLFVYSV